MTTPTLDTVLELIEQLPTADVQRLIDQINARLAAREREREQAYGDQPTTEQMLGHLLIPQAKVRAMSERNYRLRHGLHPDEPIDWDALPTAKEVREQYLSSIPYEHSLSDEIIAMRYEE